MDPNRFATDSLKNPRILRILSAALQAVDPAEAVRRHIPETDGNVYGLGIGKASIPMLTALAEALPLSGALAISKHDSSSTPSLFPVILGSHPIPDVQSLYAGQRALEFVSSLHENDTLVCLISGGGSALVTAPYGGITLEDMQALTSLLLSCGARIDEINTLRRQLDRIKGGGLARATKAKVISLILSDVIGNPLEAIASGPTVPDPTTRTDAIEILKKYHLEEKVPDSITNFLESNFLESSLLESASSAAGRLQSQNIIIGDNRFAAQAALEQAGREGFSAEVLTNELQGEAREVGVRLARQLREELTKRPRPFCLIAGGETTVTIQGNGKGGRNQELALAVVKELAGEKDVMLIALATDGEDGPTDAAGAVVTGESAWQAERLGVDAADHLSRNDAYPFFAVLGDLIKTGPTGTNVNDLIFLVAL
ncbi:MAG TPA: glycerate kinase [Anaerolineales bacterium]|nr:glycerate kinase [Anaerolineales bacterium]